MSQSQTSGYDILVQLSEQQLNALVLLYPLPLPPGVAALTFLYLELDAAATNSVSNGVRLSFNVVTDPGGYTGTVDFVAKFDVQLIAGKRTLGIYSVSTIPADSDVNASFPTASFVEPFVKGGFETYLVGAQQPLVSLSAVDPSSGSTDPLTPTNLHVKVIDDPAVMGIDCVTLMVNTGGWSGGDPVGVTHYLGNGPDGAVVTLSNQLLLERLIRPRLESALGASFNPPCVLASPVEMFVASASQSNWLGIVIHALDMHIVLQSMSVVIEGDHLRVTGSLGGSGTGFSASGDFSIRLDIVLSNGVLDVHQQVEAMNADVHFAWWVYALTGLAAGPVQALLLWWVQSAVNRGIDGMLGFFAVLGDRLGINSIAVPAIPLGVNGGQLTIQSVLLDDLTLQGPVTRTPAVAAGLAIQGNLYVSHTDSTTTVNGALFTGSLHIWPVGSHVVTTRRFTNRGLFSAVLSQPVFPATFSWTIDGNPISGTGSCVIYQATPDFHPVASGSTASSGSGVSSGSSHSRSLALLLATAWNFEEVTIYYQVEGAHCWIWTAAGTAVTALPLSLTLTDGAGHHSTAYKTVSCVGITVTDYIVQLLVANAWPTIGHAVAVPGGGDANDTFTAVDLMTQNRGPIVAATDRKQELSAAFKNGLTRRDTGSAAVARPTDKPTTTK